MLKKTTELERATMQQGIYLARIGIDCSFIEAPSLEFLSNLQQAHMLAVPFEDLDIPLHRIELDLKKFYNKIVVKLRGGFCYELNGLFRWLITSLGFRATMVSARVFNKTTNQYGPEFDHMALLVAFEKEYLVDVGFGDSFRTPILMPDGETEDVSGIYRVIHVAIDKFELQKKENNAWTPHYRFSREPRNLVDFDEMCSYQQDNPASHFRTRMLCTIATHTGRITLSNRSLTVTESGVKTKVDLQNQHEFNAMLLKYFNVRV
jgi:N-hydroxyarylamine O-acetyltransferase